MKHTHSDRLERWLGTDHVKTLSEQFKNFYYPVPVHGVPGNVYIMPGGDFTGEIKAGQFMNKHDGAAVTLRKLRNRIDAAPRRERALGALGEMIKAENSAMGQSLSAFSSLDAVLAAASGAKSQMLRFMKTGAAAAAIGNANDLWIRAGTPAAGAAGAAAPGGTIPVSTTNGSLLFKNIGVANSGHYLNWSLTASVINNSLLLYDRIFAVACNPNSTAAQAVTGVPTRYQNTVPGAIDYIGGNFLYPANPTTVLAATAHNYTPLVYVNDGGTAGRTAQTMTGLSACPVSGIDLSVGNWFVGLAAGDVGVKNLTSMQLSAAVATGTMDFVIAHPIAVNACPVANLACLDDGMYTSLNLTPILDNACLSFIEMPKPATTATTYSGIIRTVSE